MVLILTGDLLHVTLILPNIRWTKQAGLKRGSGEAFRPGNRIKIQRLELKMSQKTYSSLENLASHVHFALSEVLIFFLCVNFHKKSVLLSL